MSSSSRLGVCRATGSDDCMRANIWCTHAAEPTPPTPAVVARRPPPPPRMSGLRISVAGYATCGYFQRARTALLGMSTLVPSFTVEVHEHPTGDEFKAWWAALRTVRFMVDASAGAWRVSDCVRVPRPCCLPAPSPSLTPHRRTSSERARSRTRPHPPSGSMGLTCVPCRQRVTGSCDTLLTDVPSHPPPVAPLSSSADATTRWRGSSPTFSRARLLVAPRACRTETTRTSSVTAQSTRTTWLSLVEDLAASLRRRRRRRTARKSPCVSCACITSQSAMLSIFTTSPPSLPSLAPLQIRRPHLQPIL